MNNQAPGASAPKVILHHGQAVTTSIAVAEYFHKQHKNVLQSIENLIADCPEEFTRLNFQPSSYTNAQGKEQPCYELTKDGFMMLAMGFTGQKAIQWKLKFLAAFNRMEAKLIKREQLRAERAAKQLPAPAAPLQELPAEVLGAMHRLAHRLSLEGFEAIRTRLEKGLRDLAPQRSKEALLQWLEECGGPDAELIVLNVYELWNVTSMVRVALVGIESALAAVHELERKTGRPWYGRRPDAEEEA